MPARHVDDGSSIRIIMGRPIGVVPVRLARNDDLFVIAPHHRRPTATFAAIDEETQRRRVNAEIVAFETIKLFVVHDKLRPVRIAVPAYDSARRFARGNQLAPSHNGFAALSVFQDKCDEASVRDKSHSPLNPPSLFAEEFSIGFAEIHTAQHALNSSAAGSV